MRQKFQKRHTTDVLFVLVLFLVFTASAFALILLGAKVYQSTSSRMENNYTVRTALAYVSEKIHHYDISGTISLEDKNGIPALTFTEKIEGIPYITYIYFHDRSVKELFVKESQQFLPDQGSRIVDLADFTIEETEDGFYLLNARDDDGETLSLYVRPKSETSSDADTLNRS